MSLIGTIDKSRAANASRNMWLWIIAGMIALLLVAPYFLYPVFLMRALCMAIFACSANLLIGYVGLLSIGQAMFLGTAAYLTAYSAKYWGLPFEAAVLFGVAVAGLLGLVTGWLSIRRTGMYFAMVTLALSQLVYLVYVRAPFTGGENGIQRVPRGMLLGMLNLGDDLTLYYVIAGDFYCLLSPNLPYHPLAVRPDRQGDPRK